MDELQNSSLYLDDGDAVPPVDFLEKWAAEKDITVVVRKDLILESIHSRH